MQGISTLSTKGFCIAESNISVTYKCSCFSPPSRWEHNTCSWWRRTKPSRTSWLDPQLLSASYVEGLLRRCWTRARSLVTHRVNRFECIWKQFYDTANVSGPTGIKHFVNQPYIYSVMPEMSSLRNRCELTTRTIGATLVGALTELSTNPTGRTQEGITVR